MCCDVFLFFLFSGQTRESKSVNITTENTEGNVYYVKDVTVSNDSGFVVAVAVIAVVGGVVLVAAVGAAVFMKKFQTCKTADLKCLTSL